MIDSIVWRSLVRVVACILLVVAVAAFVLRNWWWRHLPFEALSREKGGRRKENRTLEKVSQAKTIISTFTTSSNQPSLLCCNKGARQSSQQHLRVVVALLRDYNVWRR